MIYVDSQVTIYEENYKETDHPRKMLNIQSHWSNNDRVILVYGDVKITVLARDLHAAIVNATNTGLR